MQGARTRTFGSSAIARLCLLVFASAAALWAQPTITSLNSSRVGNLPFNPPVTGITSGPQLANSGPIVIYINGAFLNGVPPIVTWTAPSQPTVTLANLSVSVTQISVLVPDPIFSTTAVAAVTPVAIKVQQNTSSASANFFLNPPLSSPPVLLPIGSVGQPYSTPLVLGGTPPYAVNPGSFTIPGLTIGTGPNNQLLAGTPTTAGSLPVQPTFTDMWNVGVNQPFVGYFVPPAAIATPASLTVPAGSPSLASSLLGTGFVDQFLLLTTTFPGSQAQWQTASGLTNLTTTFVSSSRLDIVVPSSLLLAPGSATILVLQPDGTISNLIPVNVIAPVLQNISPSAGAPGIGFTLTATGLAFVANPTASPASPQIRFGTTLLATTLNPTGTLTAVVPGTLVTSSATGIPVVVINPGGSVSNSLPFNTVGTLALGFNSLGQGTSGTPYTFRVTAVGGIPPYTFSALGLPPGLGFNALTGDIAGIPLVPGTYSVRIDVTDRQTTVQGTFSLVIVLPPPQITTPSALPGGTVGVAYVATIDANGANIFTFSLAGGALPDGLSLLGNGLIFGRPTTPGTFSFSVAGVDVNGTTVGKGFTITIQPAPLVVPGSGAITGTVGKALSADLTPTGGVTPYRFSANCVLPAGLTFNNGIISGTPTTPGSTTCRIVVSDSAGAVVTKDVTITIAPPGLALPGGTLPGGQVGVSYSAQVTATGGAPPFTYSGSGAPDGIGVSSSGAIAGTPTTDGTFSVSITATDATGAKATGAYSIIILPPKLTVTTASLPDGTVGVAYSATLTSSGGTRGFTWTATGLPDGITATAAGVISGTPLTAGRFAVTVTVKDSAGSTATATYNVTIAFPPLVITTTTVPGGTVGAAYNVTFTGTGGNQQLTWSAINLPAGLRISAAGALTGTPTTPGTSNITIGLADSTGAAVTRIFSIVIVLPTVPPLNFGGVTDTSNPLQQPRLTVSLGSVYPVDVVVTLTLTFTPDSFGDDPAIQFAPGGRTARIVVPAGATVGSTDVGIQTGSAAGVIAIAAQLQAAGADVTPTPAPRRTVRINPAAPVITTVTAARNATGFTVTATGYVTSREMTQANFTFAAAGGQTLGTTALTVPADTLFSGYFGSTAAAPFGGQFTFTQGFTVNGTSQVASVTVTLVNRVGSSAAVTATVN